MSLQTHSQKLQKTQPQTQPHSQQTCPKHWGRPPKSASQHKQTDQLLPSISEQVIVSDYEFFPQSQ